MESNKSQSLDMVGVVSSILAAPTNKQELASATENAGQHMASGRMKRVKLGCCFRLEYGPRMGRMCGAQISGYSRVVDAKLCSDLADYCLRHQELIFKRRAKADPLAYLGEPAP